MKGSVRDTAYLIQQQANTHDALLEHVTVISSLLCTAPIENREWWQGELQGYRQLKIELMRYARICERAEQMLDKGLSQPCRGIRL